MLRVVVLGAAAGGGVPQWNCGCGICRAARDDHPELRSTQASVAITADGPQILTLGPEGTSVVYRAIT